MSKFKINTYNDFDKLNSIILGKPYFIGKLDKNKNYSENILRRYKYKDELFEDRENLVKILKDNNIEVIDIPDYNIEDINKLNDEVLNNKKYFKYDNAECLISSVRDNIFTYGNKMLIHHTDRYKIHNYIEHANSLLKNNFDCEYTKENKIFSNKYFYDYYFNNNKEFSYKPESFFEEKTKNINLNSINSIIQIDAANIIKLGKDIFINIANYANLYCYKFLKEFFNEYNINWHPLNICFKHIDGTIVPLREGLLLTHQAFKNYIDDLIPLFKTWDKIYVDSIDIDYKTIDLTQKPKYGTTEINILSLDKNTIICRDENYNKLNNLLKKYNINIIPIKLRHEDLWCGSFHCITCDINRDSKQENYF